MFAKFKESKYQVFPQSGFTLIELMIVIAVIGIILSLIIFSLQDSRKSARDARRKSDLETIRSALELYKSDSGSYPTSTGAFAGSGWNDVNDSTSPIYIALIPNYISTMPQDPRYNATHPACNSNGYAYAYRRNGAGYQLVAGMEAQTVTNCINWCGGGPAPVSCYVVVNP